MSLGDKGLGSKAERIGRVVRSLRVAAGLSQGELALRVRVAREAISNWERGKHMPNAVNLEDLARALGTTVATIESADDEGRQVERRNAAANRIHPRMPPRAYELVYEHCRTLQQAVVPEDVIEEARRLMSGETFNTLHAQMADERDERGWINDVQAAWAFIRQTLEAQGYEL